MFARYTKILLFFTLLTIANIAYAVDRNLVEHVKNGVVSIHKNTFLTAYGHTGESWGTGFVIDKEAGLILTNAHIAAKKDVALYEVSFFNGQKSKAKYIYHDPHIDFALIKVDPESIPTETNALKLKDHIAIGQDKKPNNK